MRLALSGAPIPARPNVGRAPEHDRLQQVVWQGRTAPRDSASLLFRTDANSRRLADA